MAEVTPTGTDIQISTDSAFSTIVLNDSGPYRAVRAFSKGELPYGVSLFARVRHKHPYTGNTPWSASLQFLVIVPANIIGVCLDNTGVKGVFYWIDALGNKLETFNWADHPTYKGISMATVDDARSPVTLTKFPLFYVKTAASGPVNTFSNGKKCWWISDLLDTGFRPASCFKRSSATDAKGKRVISPYCYMGTYMGHQETVGGVACIGSKKTQTVVTGQSKATFKTYITNRNNAVAGISGFRMFDIWDLSALRMLLLIANAHSDSQTKWGDNTATAAPKTGATSARAVFQGSQAAPVVSMEDLWKCYYSYVDLISTNNGVVTLTSPMDLVSSLSFGSAEVTRYTQSITSGWLRDVLDCPFVLGDDTHDLMELFLPKTAVASEAQGTFCDQFFMNDAVADVFCSGSFNYLETYQNYEQTGTTVQHGPFRPSNWLSGCNYLTYVGDGDYWCSLTNTACYFPNGNNPMNWCDRTKTVAAYGYVTRTRAKNYTTEPGIFSLAKGIPYPTYNTAIYGCRLCKS
jgi:hypothetical protein